MYLMPCQVEMMGRSSWDSSWTDMARTFYILCYNMLQGYNFFSYLNQYCELNLQVVKKLIYPEVEITRL